MNNLRDVIVAVQKVLSLYKRNEFCNEQEWNDHQAFLKALKEDRFDDCKDQVAYFIETLHLGYGNHVPADWIQAKEIVDLYMSTNDPFFMKEAA